jgi:hypothetical protein
MEIYLLARDRDKWNREMGPWLRRIRWLLQLNAVLLGLLLLLLVLKGGGCGL